MGLSEVEALQRIAQLDADPSAFLRDVEQTESRRRAQRSAAVVLLEKALYHATAGGRGLTRFELEGITGLSTSHLTKLLTDMASAGMVRSERGTAIVTTGIERLTFRYRWAANDPPME